MAEMEYILAFWFYEGHGKTDEALNLEEQILDLVVDQSSTN